MRVESYETAAWPSFAAVAFRRPWKTTAIAVVLGAIAISGLAGPFTGRQIIPADFYGVIPHGTLVMLFAIVSLFVVVALGIGHRRFIEALGNKDGLPGRRGPAYKQGVTDALTLKHLHATGEDCVEAEETRRPWRRWMHHC